MAGPKINEIVNQITDNAGKIVSAARSAATAISKARPFKHTSRASAQSQYSAPGTRGRGTPTKGMRRTRGAGKTSLR